MRHKAFAILFIAGILLSPAAYAGELKPTKDLVLLKLLVEDSAKKIVKGTIVSVRNELGERILSEVTDDKGAIQILIPKNKTYLVKFVSLRAEKTETLKKIEVPDRPFYKFTLKLIYNPTMARTFVLNGVLFDTGKDTLKPESYPKLENLLEYMLTKTTAVIELSGHTDDVGDAEDNRKLSEARAKAVKKYLVGKGVESNRINAVGYGEKVPIASNKTPDGRAKNRRTEVKILQD